jgi:ABC-type multidrug transport system ATPase subunit
MKVKDAHDQAVALLQALDLERYAHEGLTQSASVLSLEKMALSIIGKPPLIVLDDPFAHLSPTQKGLVKKVLEHCKKAGSSILMTSSRIEDFDGLADTYGLLVKGKLAVEMDSCDLKQKLSNKLHVRVDDVKRLCDLYPLAQVLDDGFVVIEDDGKVNKTLLDQGIKVYEIKRVKESKAHYFQNFLGGESHD